MTKQSEKEKLEAAKAKAKEAVGEKKTVTPDTIKFKKNSGSSIIFGVLQRARKPLTLKELTERAVEAGLKTESRAKTVANWFANNGIANKVDGKYELIAVEEAEAEVGQAA